MIKVTEKKPGHIDLNCEACGKPITVTNQYGMFCEDKCFERESIESEQLGRALIDNFLKNFGHDKTNVY